MRTPEETKEISRTFLERVFDRRDLAYLDEILSDDFIEHNPIDPSMGNDKKAALATFEAIFELSPDMKVEVHELIATEDRVAIRATYSGTDNGTGWGAPMGAGPTGKRASIQGIDVAILNDRGQFREHYGLFDVMGMMMQLGLMPGS